MQTNLYKHLRRLNQQILEIMWDNRDKKGEKTGTQRKILDTNPRASYSACGYHSLNLAPDNDILENIKYEDFILRNTKRMMVFSRKMKVSLLFWYYLLPC